MSQGDARESHALFKRIITDGGHGIGEDLSGIFALRRALNAFIRELPEGLRLSMAEPPVDATTVEKKKRKKKQKQTKDEPAPTGEAAVTEGSKEEEQA